MESQKASRDEALLISVAESVGSTLGTLAAKANAVQKALTPGRKRSKPRTAKAKARTKRAVGRRKPARNKRAGRARRKS